MLIEENLRAEMLACKSRNRCGGVWPSLMAALSSLGGEGCPVLVPHPAVFEGGEGHHGFGVGGIPAAAPVFDALGRRFAFRFRRS